MKTKVVNIKNAEIVKKIQKIVDDKEFVTKKSKRANSRKLNLT